jgi:hypothetical protein
VTAPTMVAMKKPSAPQHPWTLVAPWWKWANPANSMNGRITRPVFQKYETSKLVDEFIRNPQHALKWMDEDLVHVARALAKMVDSSGRSRRLADWEYVVDALRTRKIFLDTHKRFYLVVCQIHCDAPGFPRAARGDVCSAGFVVRRRTTSIPPAGAKAAGEILKSLNGARTQLGAIDAEAARSASVNTTTLAGTLSSLATTSIARQRASTIALVESERARLFAWAAHFNVVPKLQGWFNDPNLEKIGAWADVSDRPAALNGEAVFPMYPLIPPKGDVNHAGQFGTIYFGLLPTGTGETDTQAHPRFDDREYYEVSCFAERHLIPHDRGSPCHCPDSLFWSLPTESYRLAGHFDVVGTGRRPVTVQMPDINELAAQAAPTFGVAFAKPVGSLMVSGDASGKPKSHGRSTKFEICSFSIPLITIVASFVFELFLPVLLIMFQLWFMLKLKFCILPEVEVAAGVTAEIAVTPATLNLEASLKVAVDASIDASFGPPQPGKDDHSFPEARSALQNLFSPIATANMTFAAVSAANGGGPDLTQGLEFEVEVPHPTLVITS